MKQHHFIFRILVVGVLISGTAVPVSAQTPEEWAAHNQRVARVRAELKNLEAAGKIINVTLAEWLRLSRVRDPGEDMGDEDVKRLYVEIDKEKRLRVERDASAWSPNDVPPPAWGSQSSSDIYPSRIFAGPTQYPPTSFAAYGVVAFPSRAAPEEIERYRMICEAYITTLPHFSELHRSLDKQMVTVWPIGSDEEAAHLNAEPLDDTCKSAVQHYGLLASLKAIRDARLSNGTINGRGPFLLAWSPAAQRAQVGSLVLISNLSDVTTLEQAKGLLSSWSSDIQKNPDIWEKGWNIDKLKLVIRLWADKYGTQFLELVGAKG
jgi:hypothetical protein